MDLELQEKIMLTNNNGVKIDSKIFNHWATSNAKCCCGEPLMVAPQAFDVDHQKGNPVMVCGDHGVHAYMFKDLVIGSQPENA